jgi:hypothetical protein
MKRSIVLLTISIFFVPFLLGGCWDDPPVFPNEPGGFRGIIWGQSALTVAGLTPLGREDPITTYVREYEIMKIGTVPLKQITYTFFRDRFYSVMIDFEEYPNFWDLKKQLSTLYGPGEQKASVWRNQWWWYGTNLNIRLNYSHVTQTGTLVYSYIPIYEESTTSQMERSRRGFGEL